MTAELDELAQTMEGELDASARRIAEIDARVRKLESSRNRAKGEAYGRKLELRRQLIHELLAKRLDEIDAELKKRGVLETEPARVAVQEALDAVEGVLTCEPLPNCPEPNPKWRTEWDRSVSGFELSRLVGDISYSRLRGKAKAVLRALADRHNHEADFSSERYAGKPHTTIFAGNRDIGDRAGVVPRSVTRVNRELQDRNFGFVLQGGESSNSTNYWILNVAGIRQMAKESEAEREATKQASRSYSRKVPGESPDSERSRL